MKIKFNNQEKFYTIDEYKFINSNIVRLIGENVPENTFGFDIYDDEDNLLHANSDYVVIYDKGEDFVEYTNDTNIYYVYYIANKDGYVNRMRIYTSPIPPVNTAWVLFKSGQGKEFAEATSEFAFIDEEIFYNYKIVDGELVEVTSEEKDNLRAERITQAEESVRIAFENNKMSKIEESKVLLATYLENHPLVSTCHGGVEATYNVTAEKQNLMTSHYATYTIEKNLGLNPVLKWNSTGEECEEWTEEEFILLVLQIKSYVEPLVSLQQSYEVQIRNCTTQEELDTIKIVYDVYGIAE